MKISPLIENAVSCKIFKAFIAIACPNSAVAFHTSYFKGGIVIFFMPLNNLIARTRLESFGLYSVFFMLRDKLLKVQENAWLFFIEFFQINRIIIGGVIAVNQCFNGNEVAYLGNAGELIRTFG